MYTSNLIHFCRIIHADMGKWNNSIKIFEKVLDIYKDLDYNEDQSCFSNTIDWIVYLREKVFLNNFNDGSKGRDRMAMSFVG